MDESAEISSNSMIKNIIGILMIMPIYMVIFIILNLLNLNNGDNDLLFPLLMYLPIIIGMLLSYKKFNDKISYPIGICILILICLAIYFYYNTYFGEYSELYPGLERLGYFVFWLGTTAICKILSCIFYGKIVGWKKALIFLGIYILLVVLSFSFGFWD